MLPKFLYKGTTPASISFDAVGAQESHGCCFIYCCVSDCIEVKFFTMVSYHSLICREDDPVLELLCDNSTENKLLANAAPFKEIYRMLIVTIATLYDDKYQIYYLHNTCSYYVNNNNIGQFILLCITILIVIKFYCVCSSFH